MEIAPGRDPSVRSIFYERLKVEKPNFYNRVLLAEEANKWYRAAGIYPNLVVLESDIAALSSLILLFVESAGSIAELGAFSFASEFKKKLVAVVEEGHYSELSFIKEGPLTSLEQEDCSSVRAYPWLADVKGQKVLDRRLCDEAVEKIIDQIAPDMKALEGERAFQSSDHGHLMLLIADLVELAGATTESEIQTLLGTWKIEINSNQFKQFQFLLENLKLIQRKKYGNKTYLLPIRARKSYIKYPPEVSGKVKVIDRLRFRDLLRKALPADRDRAGVYKRYVQVGKK